MVAKKLKNAKIVAKIIAKNWKDISINVWIFQNCKSIHFKIFRRKKFSISIKSWLGFASWNDMNTTHKYVKINVQNFYLLIGIRCIWPNSLRILENGHLFSKFDKLKLYSKFKFCKVFGNEFWKFFISIKMSLLYENLKHRFYECTFLN